MNTLKNNWPKIILVCAIILAAGLIVYMFFGSYLPGNSYWQQRKLLSDLERPYRTDTYGGKTPEETFNMFLSALKSGDVELASKYFEPERQIEKLKDLQLSKENGNLNKDTDYVEGAWNRRASKIKEDERVLYQYEINVSKREPVYDKNNNIVEYVEPGNKYISDILFLFNTYTKVWKISEI